MRIRAVASCVLACVIFAPCIAGASGVSDVSNTRYVPAYNYLVGRGVIDQGASGRPFDRLTRAEALKAIVEMHARYREYERGIDQRIPSIPLFNDVDQSRWYAPYVETAFAMGLIEGYPDHSFHPTAPVSAEEGITMLLRSYGIETTTAPERPWYESAVAEAFRRNLVSSAERLSLGYPLTRGQFFDMLYRLDVVWTGKLVAFSEEQIPAVPWNPAPAMPVPAPAKPVVTEQNAVVPSSKNFAITIPTLGIRDLTVTHPADPTSSDGLLAPLETGVGHLFSYPGSDGKIMIYGHSSGYPWDVSQYTKIFRRVNELKIGDRVYVTYRGTLHTYDVTYKQTVGVDDLQPFSGQGEELILYTCWPPDSIKERYLVHAAPEKTVAQR